MGIPSYDYNPDHVTRLDGGYIEETGSYAVTIKSAAAIQANKGTWGVSFDFIDENGQGPRFPVTIWTLSADGKRLFGHDILDSILICAGMKPASALKPGKVNAPEWDATERKMVEKETDGYPALTNRAVGLLLQKEHYTKNDGNPGSRLLIVGAYNADTWLSAGEMIGGYTDATATAKKIKSLKDKDSTGNGYASATPASAQKPTPKNEDFDDEIPF